MTEDKRSDDVFEQLKSHAKFTDGGAILDNIKTRVDPAKLVDSLNSNGNVSDLFVDPLLREKGRIRPLKRKASLNILTTSEAELKQTNIVSNVFVRMTSKDKGAEFDPMTMLGKSNYFEI